MDEWMNEVTTTERDDEEAAAAAAAAAESFESIGRYLLDGRRRRALSSA